MSGSGEDARQRGVGKPVLLDLFCGAGGATKGYQRAGFYVIGVDIARQPHYCGDEFIQADAVAMAGNLDCWTLDVAAIHASPPCQRWSAMSTCRPALADAYPALRRPRGAGQPRPVRRAVRPRSAPRVGPLGQGLRTRSGVVIAAIGNALWAAPAIGFAVFAAVIGCAVKERER